jgi:hypothetical protein
MVTGRVFKADETTEAERSDKLGASGEAAGDLDAILVDHSDDDGDIRKRAHAIWVAEGRPRGRELEHWLQAQAEVAKMR